MKKSSAGAKRKEKSAVSNKRNWTKKLRRCVWKRRHWPDVSGGMRMSVGNCSVERRGTEAPGTEGDDLAPIIPWRSPLAAVVAERARSFALGEGNLCWRQDRTLS